MEDNYAASDAEHLPRLTKTISRETPNPERFVNETIEEWVAADTSTRLVDNGVLDRETAHFFRTAGRPRDDRDMANRNFPRRSWSSAGVDVTNLISGDFVSLSQRLKVTATDNRSSVFVCEPVDPEQTTCGTANDLVLDAPRP